VIGEVEEKRHALKGLRFRVVVRSEDGGGIVHITAWRPSARSAWMQADRALGVDLRGTK
jgi:hypothetical protein